MKKHLILFVLILLGIVSAYSQGFGYSYGSGNENVQTETPMAVVGADRPNDVWAVSGNLQPFGTCTNDVDARIGRRKPPTTGGGDPTNPDIKKDSPIGDVDGFCWLLLGGYLLSLTIRSRCKAKREKHLCKETHSNYSIK